MPMSNTISSQPKLKHENLIGLTLILSAFMCSADSMTLQPSVALMAKTVFKQYSYGTVSLIITISNIAMFVIALATALLLRIGKKRLLCIGSILFSIGGFIGFFISNFPLILCTRLIEGFGAGLVLTVSMILIPELFRDENKINKWMGLNAVMMAATAAVIGFTSGLLAVKRWNLPFIWYLAGFIVLILQILFIPADPAGTETSEQAGKTVIDRRGILHGLHTFLYSLFGSMFFIGISGITMENGIGSADMTGTATTINTLGSFLFSFAFAYIMKKTKAFAPVIFYVMMLVSLFIMVDAHSMVRLCIGAFIYGSGYQSYTAYVMAKVSMISTPKSEAGNMSFCNAMYYLAMFVNSFWISLIMKLGHTNSTVFVMKIQLVCVAVMTAYVLIKAIVYKGQFTRTPETNR